MPRRLSQLWVVYLAAGAAAIGVYFLLPRNSSEQAFVYDAIGLSSAIAVVLGAFLNRARNRWPWLLFAIGLLGFAIGDTIFNLYAYVWHKAAPVPSTADIFYLGAYPFLAAGFARLIVGFRSIDRRAGLIDSAIVTVAFAIGQWVFLMNGLVHGAGSTAGKAVSAAYPGMDVVLLSGLAIFFLTPTWRTVSYRFLAVSILLLLFADEVYATSPATYAPATWLDSFWLGSYVLWGVAALHPTMTRLSDRHAAGRLRLSVERLLLLSAALLTAPAVILIQRANGDRIDSVPIVIGAALVALLVMSRVAGLFTDVEGARLQLREQNERLREADRVKDEFVALISHDLRTPLTSIMGYLELAMDDGQVTDEQRGYLEVVQRNSERLLRLVNDLLFVARLEAGELDLHESELDLAAIVRTAVEEAVPRARAKAIALHCEAEEVPPLSGDRGRMFQLLANLVSNAIKFTPEGGRVDVRLARRGDVVQIAIADTGIGIDSDEQRRLFERFFRASTAHDHRIPGTGLGLYIARAIAEAHGGRIDVESELGAGTTFRVDLPLVRDTPRREAHVVGDR